MYKKYVTAYAQEQLGKPLEKVSVFFEGVTSEIENGRREEEIQFQQLYNKSELKKAIKQYPGKKVETGLKELYARVEKHTAEDDNRLLQVVWREMQAKFFSNTSIRDWQRISVKIVKKTYKRTNLYGNIRTTIH